MSVTPELEGTEIYDTEIPRVDAVFGPATSIPFLIMKSADAPASDPLRKADQMADAPVAEDLDLTETPKVDGDVVDPGKAGDADLPGSPTWEAVDAAAARSALSQLTSLRSLINGLAAREAAEGDDWSNQWNMEDAAEAIDYALSLLAKFAVDEQASADDAAEDAKADARAMGLIKALHLDEASVAVIKAGRVLSASNEAALRQANDSITAILAQIDTAPVAAEGGETVVAKAQDPSTPLPIAITSLLSQLSVAYSAWEADGTAPATPDATLAAVDPDAVVDPADPNTPVVPAVTVPVADPNAPIIVKALEPVETEPAEVQTALEKSLADRIEAIVAERTAAIEKRLHAVESTPVNDGPMLSGAKPVQRGESTTEGDELADLRKSLATEQDPAVKAAGVARLIASAQRLPLL